MIFISLLFMWAFIRVVTMAACAIVSIVLLLSVLRCYGGSYSNSWAVQVLGGGGEADRVALKHGFLNRGKVAIQPSLDPAIIVPLDPSLTETLQAFCDVVMYHQLLAESNSTISTNLEALLQRTLHDGCVWIGNLADHYHFELVEGTGKLHPMKTHGLQSESQVGFVEQQVIKRHVYKDYHVPGDPKWSIQWALKNTGSAGGPPALDLNVEPAWLQGITGRGVVVAVVDNGLEILHPDLKDNYAADESYDFAEEDRDPTPDYSGDNSHGTSCAGEVAMAKNGVCGIGVAYESSIAGLKIDLESSSDVVEARALGFQANSADVYSNSWGPADYGFSVEGPGKLVQQTFINAVKNGRGGKGSIFVWAAGNGGDYYDSCAADGYASSVYTIAVGSADQTGAQAYYDEQCSGKMAVTFSYNAAMTDKQISTTTIHGKCTDDFTGTSASTPLMSGVVALTLQANPDLTWRDVQYLIAYTSNTELLSGGEWTTNGAGLKVSHKFGFGAVDAEAMVTRARRWINVPQQLQYSVPLNDPGSASYGAAYNKNLTVSCNITFLEHVVLEVSLELQNYGRGYNVTDIEDVADYDELNDFLEDPHPRRGDIEVQLTSPAGTQSILLPYRNYDFINVEGYDSWPFKSVHYWGEVPDGIWTFKVFFRSFNGSVAVRDAVLMLYGTANTPLSVETIPTHCDTTCARNCSAAGCDVCRLYRNSSSLDCVSSCTSTESLYNNYCIDGVVIYPSTTVSAGLVAGVVIAVIFVVVVVVVCLAIAIAAVLVKRKVKLRQAQGYRLAFEADEFDEQTY